MDKFLEQGVKALGETSIGQSIMGLLDDIFGSFKERFLEMTLPELADMYSEEIDKIILEKEEQFNYKYIGGEFRITYMDDEYFRTSMSLYFQDASKQWIKTSSKSKLQSMKYLKQEAIARLRSEKTVAFEIEPPKKKTIKEDTTAKKDPVSKETAE